ncbi:MAG: prepilin peptidase, partial [Clostridiales bacterium]|nr:prepilin peptidase [Clostridiales bacterium]
MINAICYVFISILLIRAVYTDVLWGRIENWVVGIGMVGGMTYIVVTKGSMDMWDAGKHVLLLGLMMYVLYRIGGLGAGDVKLMIMAGMWMPQYGFRMAAGAFFIGAG